MASKPMTPTTKAASIGAVATAIIAAVFVAEGAYVNNPKDPGGETNHGITKAVAVQHGYTGSMKALTKELAASIYYQDYIVAPGYAPFLDISPAIAEELVDTAVNTGQGRTSRWLQTSLNLLSQEGTLYPQIVVDGRVGPATIRSYQGLQRARGKVQACRLIIKSMDVHQGQHYFSISQSNPKLQAFTTGWITNRLGNVPLSHCG